jgi:peroxiredoxin Q/BCP
VRLRSDYASFTKRNAEIIAIGPEGPDRFQAFWTLQDMPFIGLPDPNHNVANTYKQEVNIFKLGRMPLNCIVDQQGRIRYIHYGSSMADIPDNKMLLHVIDEINTEGI